VIIEPVSLAGRYVRLEPLTLNHLDALCVVGFDEELWRWTTTRLRAPEDMREYIETALRWQAEGTALPFATVELAAGRVVGSTRFANIDRANRRVEIGYTWIAPAWQRTAVNTEAKYLMLRHAFEQWNVIRVELKTDALNEKSRRAMTRIGAQEEGVFRNHMICHGGRIRDTAWFSFIDSEWPQVKADLEQKLAG
jgi:RimJ/RimL family protein N-acetyltransferase